MKTITKLEETALLNYFAPRFGDDPTGRFPNHHNHLNKTTWKQYRNLTATLLMLDAGLRVGEVIGLWLDDCYFHFEARRTLIVPARCAKGKKERSIPMTLRLIIAINLMRCDRIDLHDMDLIQPLIARSPWGKAITTRTLERILCHAAIAALGRSLHPHMLRHTYATKLMKVTDIRTVQELLGHKHVSSTQIYTHVNHDDKLRAIKDMQESATGGILGAAGSHLPG